MAITKEQWTGIENALKRGLVINFTRDGHEISLSRTLVSETKLGYVVHIDKDIPKFWLKEGEAGFNPLVEVYFRKIIYKPWQKFINQISKERGGKSFLKRKENAHYHETKVRYEPFFPSAKAAVNHFKKLKGLELNLTSAELLEA